MNFHILTLFPEMIEQGLSTSIIGRAKEKGLLRINAIDMRNYTLDKHRRVDDYPYGGGAGMVIQAEPVYKAYQALEHSIAEKHKQEGQNELLANGNGQEGTEETFQLEENSASESKKLRVIYVTPQGTVFHQEMAKEFAKEEDLVFLCGHYEGIDERVLEMIVTDYVSIGDYVLTGGELPAMVMIDAISRHVPGVLNNSASAEFETFEDNLLEYPQYTRPEEFMGRRVPEVLLSGHHANIETWRRQQSIIRTKKTRPDLLKDANLNKKERTFLEQLIQQEQSSEEGKD